MSRPSAGEYLIGSVGHEAGLVLFATAPPEMRESITLRPNIPPLMPQQIWTLVERGDGKYGIILRGRPGPEIGFSSPSMQPGSEVVLGEPASSYRFDQAGGPEAYIILAAMEHPGPGLCIVPRDDKLILEPFRPDAPKWILRQMNRD